MIFVYSLNPLSQTILTPLKNYAHVDKGDKRFGRLAKSMLLTMLKGKDLVTRMLVILLSIFMIYSFSSLLRRLMGVTRMRVFNHPLKICMPLIIIIQIIRLLRWMMKSKIRIVRRWGKIIMMMRQRSKIGRTLMRSMKS